MGWKKIVKAGISLEVERYQAYRPPSGKKRQKKMNISTPDQEQRNENQAVRKLTWLLNENFRPGDFHLTLTYSGEAPTPEEAKEELRKYLRKLREIYRREGLELKYIAVTEYKAKRIHHHLVLSQIDQRKIYGTWKRGRPKFVLLDPSGDYWRLAAYLIKETRKSFGSDRKPGERRWMASRNLVHPEPEVRKMKRHFRPQPPEKVTYQGETYWLNKDRPAEYFVEANGWEHLIAFYRRL